MNKLLTTLKSVGNFILLCGFLILALPLILIGILLFGPAALAESIMSKLRRDPKVNLAIPKSYDEEWQDAETEEQFLKAFNKMCDLIAKMSHANPGKTHVSHDNLSSKSGDKAALATFTRTLKSNNHEINFTKEIVRTYSDNRETVDLQNAEERCGSVHVQLDTTWTSPEVGRKSLQIKSDRAMWLIIGILRGDSKIAKSGQVWAYVSEKKVWVVKYKDGDDTIGQRKDFSDKKAREYWFDEK